MVRYLSVVNDISETVAELEKLEFTANGWRELCNGLFLIPNGKYFVLNTDNWEVLYLTDRFPDNNIEEVEIEELKEMHCELFL